MDARPNMIARPLIADPCPGGRGNFQSVKLQRPDRVTIAESLRSHDANYTTAMVNAIAR